MLRPVSARVHGFCKPGFAAVAEAFERGLSERGELGAAVAVHLNGELVVDLWAGLADPVAGSPWAEDTIAHAYSVSKPLVATCALVLADRGGLDLDAPVARYWPEYAQAGKDADPRPPPARPPDRDPRPPRAAAAGGPARLGPPDRAARRGAAALGARDEARRGGGLLRPPRRRGRPPRRRPQPRPLPRGGDRGAVGARLPHRPGRRRAGAGGAARRPRRRVAAVGPRRPAPLGGGLPRQPAGDARRGRRQLGRVPGRRDPRGQRPRDGAGDRALLRRPRRGRGAGRRPPPPARRPSPRRFRPQASGRDELLEDDAVWSLGFRVDDGESFGLGGIGGFSGFGLRRPGRRPRVRLRHLHARRVRPRRGLRGRAGGGAEPLELARHDERLELARRPRRGRPTAPSARPSPAPRWGSGRARRRRPVSASASAWSVGLCPITRTAPTASSTSRRRAISPSRLAP